MQITPFMSWTWQLLDPCLVPRQAGDPRNKRVHGTGDVGCWSKVLELPIKLDEICVRVRGLGPRIAQHEK